MAATGYTPISLYYSATAGHVPLAANLANGELAINIADGKLFYKDATNAAQVIGWKTTPPSAGGLGSTAVPTNGQIPIGNGTNYVAAALTAGAGISITNGAGSITIAAIISAIVPTGTIIDYAGTAAPAGFLACDGSAVSRSTYGDLFSAIGTTWGAGDGSTTFNLPDLRRKATIGAGGTAVSGPAATVGSTGGEETHTLTTAELAAHNHTDAGHNHGVSDPGHNHEFVQWHVTAAGIGDGVALSWQNFGSKIPQTQNTYGAVTGISIQTGNANIQNTGGGAAHNNMQPSAVVLKCIKY